MVATKKKALLSLLGATVVLVGFVGNEVFKDHYKDKSARVSASQSFLATRRDLFEAQVATQVTMNEKALNETHDLKATEELVFNQFMESDREDNVALGAIKDAVKDDEELKDLSDQQESLQSQSNADVNSLLEAHGAWVSAERQGANTLPLQMPEAHAQMIIVALDTQVDKLMKRTVEAIDKEKSESEKAYQRWRKTGYGCFIVGWLMNVTGILWKVDGLEADLK